MCFFGWGGRVVFLFWQTDKFVTTTLHYTTRSHSRRSTLGWPLRLQSARAMDGLGLDDIRIKRVVVVDSISHFAHAHLRFFFVSSVEEIV